MTENPCVAGSIPARGTTLRSLSFGWRSHVEANLGEAVSSIARRAAMDWRDNNVVCSYYQKH
ncbi:MAG: hypothetical protein AABY33_05805 [Pseudomonadota bacterium]